MFHLFSKIYLEDEKFYSTKYQFEILGSEEGDHPISRQLGQSFGKVLSFVDAIEKVIRNKDALLKSASKLAA